MSKALRAPLGTGGRPGGNGVGAPSLNDVYASSSARLPRGPRGGRPTRLLFQMASETVWVSAIVLWGSRHRRYTDEGPVTLDGPLLIQLCLPYRRLSGRC